MALAASLLQFLDRRRTFHALLVLNVLMVLVTLWMSRNSMLSDGWSYLNLAEGMLHGKYSMWWVLDGYYADTFRAPGYPFFIACCIKLFGTWKAVKAVNFVLYWAALHYALRTVEHLDPRRSTRSIFLLLLLPMVNIPFYINQLYTEIPVLAGLTFLMDAWVRHHRWSFLRAAGAGLLLGFLILCKPMLVALPVGMVALAWWSGRRRTDVRGQLVMLGMCALSLAPYGMWSLKHHGVFKVTPIQGGGGYMHFAYWCGKMPAYQDTISLRNFTGDELIRFTPADSVTANIIAFEREWAGVIAQLAPLLTDRDSVMMASWDRLPYAAEPTYNTAYAIKREELLSHLALEHMLHDPVYTLTYKAYTAVRLWVIGIQRQDFERASFSGKVQMLYATLSTLANFLLALVLLPWAYLRGILQWRTTWPLLATVLYVWLLHIPFTIQARYTVCARFALFVLMALALTECLRRSGAARQGP
ncbi:MAG TPA: hypothetical protein PLL57_07670 [Flavobacteriales bacterium]|nr:hypothetical protein [Flavobacteriales bacterium]